MDLPADMALAKIYSEGNFFIIGTHVILPVKSKLKEFMIPDDIKDILKNADQSIDFKVKLGATMQDIFLNEKKIIEIIEKGASAELNLELISNIRSAVMEILKNHEELDGSFKQVMMNMIPLAMCQLNGTI